MKVSAPGMELEHRIVEEEEPEGDRRKKGREEVGEGAGQGYQGELPADRGLEVPRVDHHGFGPTEDGEAGDGQEEGNQEGTEEVEVGHRVQGDPPFQLRGWVSETVCRPAVGSLVEGDREDDRGDLGDDGNDLEVHGLEG